MKKQITYNSDTKAIERLGHIAEVFTIKKAVITQVKGKWENKWRMEVDFK